MGLEEHRRGMMDKVGLISHQLGKFLTLVRDFGNADFLSQHALDELRILTGADEEATARQIATQARDLVKGAKGMDDHTFDVVTQAMNRLDGQEE